MIDQTQVQRVERVLKQIRELKEEDERAAKATGKNFNVFSVLGVERKEVRHSAFLKDLLDPKGTHSQGIVFLKHFLKLPPLLEKLPRLFYENFGEFQVTKEQYAPYSDDEHGWIDIFLKKRDACIIIENKIDKSLDPGQLNKYYTYARGYFEDRQIGLIYLTPDGKKPSEESLAGQESLDADRVICISYESHLVEWLEDCLKEVVGIARLHDILLQYQKITEKPTGQPINKELTMKISDILIKNYDLIPELESSISEAKEHIHDKFWKKLADKICGIERLDDVKVKDGMVPKDDKITAKVLGFELEPPLTMELIIGEGGGVWYGFGVFKKDQRVSERDKGRIQRYLDLAGGKPYTNTKLELDTKYKFLKDRNQRYLFDDFKAGQMCDIIDDDKLEELVDGIAQEIKAAVDKFIKAKEDAGL